MLRFLLTLGILWDGVISPFWGLRDARGDVIANEASLLTPYACRQHFGLLGVSHRKCHVQGVTGDSDSDSWHPGLLDFTWLPKVMAYVALLPVFQQLQRAGTVDLKRPRGWQIPQLSSERWPQELLLRPVVSRDTLIYFLSLKTSKFCQCKLCSAPVAVCRWES